MTNKSQQISHNSFKIKAHTNVDNKKRVCYIYFIKYKHRGIEMSGVNIDWKGKALAAEAETLNLKNLCAHHCICTVCGGYYSHHYTEPFATCKCNTSEWHEITEYMKLQDELRKLREQKPFGRYVKIIDPIDKNKHTYGVDYYSGFYVADLLDKEVYTEPTPRLLCLTGT